MLGYTSLHPENVMSQSARATKTNIPKPAEKQVFSRHELVGKFPHIRHQAAPRATKYMLTVAQRDAIVDKMLLRDHELDA